MTVRRLGVNPEQMIEIAEETRKVLEGKGIKVTHDDIIDIFRTFAEEGLKKVHEWHNKYKEDVNHEAVELDFLDVFDVGIKNDGIETMYARPGVSAKGVLLFGESFEDMERTALIRQLGEKLPKFAIIESDTLTTALKTQKPIIDFDPSALSVYGFTEREIRILLNNPDIRVVEWGGPTGKPDIDGITIPIPKGDRNNDNTNT